MATSSFKLNNKWEVNELKIGSSEFAKTILSTLDNYDAKENANDLVSAGAIKAALNAIDSANLSYKYVEKLPENPVENTIYIVPDSEHATAGSQNLCTEWLCYNAGTAEAKDLKLEKIGEVGFDYSAVTKELTAIKDEIGTGFSADSTVAEQLTAVKNTADSAIQDVSTTATGSAGVSLTLAKTDKNVVPTLSVTPGEVKAGVTSVVTGDAVAAADKAITDIIGGGFSASSTVAAQLGAVKDTADAALQGVSSTAVSGDATHGVSFTLTENATSHELEGSIGITPAEYTESGRTWDSTTKLTTAGAVKKAIANAISDEDAAVEAKTISATGESTEAAEGQTVPVKVVLGGTVKNPTLTVTTHDIASATALGTEVTNRTNADADIQKQIGTGFSEAKSIATVIGAKKDGGTAGSGILGDIESLQEAIGQGGSVDTQIDTKIRAITFEKGTQTNATAAINHKANTNDFTVDVAVADATGSAKGVVTLSDTINSTSAAADSVAATPAAVKAAVEAAAADASTKANARLGTITGNNGGGVSVTFSTTTGDDKTVTTTVAVTESTLGDGTKFASDDKNVATGAKVQAAIDAAEKRAKDAQTYTADEVTIHVDGNEFSAKTAAVAASAATLTTGGQVYTAIEDAKSTLTGSETVKATTKTITKAIALAETAQSTAEAKVASIAGSDHITATPTSETDHTAYTISVKKDSVLDMIIKAMNRACTTAGDTATTEDKLAERLGKLFQFADDLTVETAAETPQA